MKQWTARFLSLAMVLFLVLSLPGLAMAALGDQEGGLEGRATEEGLEPQRRQTQQTRGVIFSVTYHANNNFDQKSTGRLDRITEPSPGFTVPKGKVFSHWNTQPDGQGDNHYPGDEFERAEDAPADLYAIWVWDDINWTVQYNTANGGKGGPTNKLVKAGTEHTLLDGEDVGIFRDGSIVNSWGVSGGPSYSPGDVITVDDDMIVLYASWAAGGRLRIEADPGGEIVQGESKLYKVRTTVNLEASALPNYTFTGWTASYGNVDDETQAITSYTMPDKSVADMVNIGEIVVTAHFAPASYDLTLAPLSNDTVTVGEPYHKQVDYNYTGHDTVVLEADNLPAGLLMDGVNKAITGTPTQLGSFDVVVTAREDTGNLSVSEGYTLVVKGKGDEGGGKPGGGDEGGGTTTPPPSGGNSGGSSGGSGGGSGSSGGSGGGSGSSGGSGSPSTTRAPGDSVAVERMTTGGGSGNSNSNYRFRVDLPALGFVSATVDGDEIVRRQDYTIREGSTILTLSDSYVSTLKPGTHTLRMEFLAAVATVEFTVDAPGQAGGAGSRGAASGDMDEPEPIGGAVQSLSNGNPDTGIEPALWDMINYDLGYGLLRRAGIALALSLVVMILWAAIPRKSDVRVERK